MHRASSDIVASGRRCQDGPFAARLTREKSSVGRGGFSGPGPFIDINGICIKVETGEV